MFRLCKSLYPFLGPTTYQPYFNKEEKLHLDDHQKYCLKLFFVSLPCKIRLISDFIVCTKEPNAYKELLDYSTTNIYCPHASIMVRKKCFHFTWEIKGSMYQSYSNL